MSILFYLLGLIGIAFGSWWVASAFANARSAGSGTMTSMEALGTLIAAAPGFSVLMSGLVLLAIGGILSRLDAVVRYSRQAARTLKEIQRPGE